MNYKDILAMASAYKEVAEGSYKTTKKEAMDPVDAKALKGKHKDRKDKDIDNDGDVDSSDEYLHKRRKAVSKSIKGKGKETEVEVQTQESVDEAKSHGNMDNGSPRGEGLSPSAKKELDRTTPMNPATDEKAVNAMNFKQFKTMTKKSKMRPGDNSNKMNESVEQLYLVLNEYTGEEFFLELHEMLDCGWNYDDLQELEEFTQIDEISDKAKKSYLKKAIGGDHENSLTQIKVDRKVPQNQRSSHTAVNVGSNAELDRKARNRAAGIKRVAGDKAGRSMVKAVGRAAKQFDKGAVTGRSANYDRGQKTLNKINRKIDRK